LTENGDGLSIVFIIINFSVAYTNFVFGGGGKLTM
jgi:hypothetical protein